MRDQPPGASRSHDGRRPVLHQDIHQRCAGQAGLRSGSASCVCGRVRIRGFAVFGHGLLMAAKTKAWHDCKDQQQGKVDRARNLVTATEKFSKCLTLEHNRKAEFRADRQGKRKNPGSQGTTRRTYAGETPQDEASSEEDDCCHDGHLCEFRPAFAYSWFEKGDSKDTQHETSAKHDCEGSKRSANNLVQGECSQNS